MKTYTIKEISQMFDIPSSTLRYYEDMGLLTNVSRTETNQRIYTDEHINRLGSINCFKNTGLPISKMQAFFQYEADLVANIDNIIALVTQHEEDTKQQVEKIQNDLSHIQHKVRYYNGIKDAIEAGTPWPKWDDYNI